jgi:adenylate kinase
MVNIVLFGAPGTGKGTQSGLIIESYHMVHLSTGDLLRAAIAEGTPLGLEAKGIIDQGQLVPDDVILGMVREHMKKNPQARGFVFDGFPRTIAQAEALDRMLEEAGGPIEMVFYLEVDEDELFKRILHRAQISGRTDDNEETIRKRIDVYKSQTYPLIDYYDAQKKVIRIDGMHSIDQVFSVIRKSLDKVVG